MGFQEIQETNLGPSSSAFMQGDGAGAGRFFFLKYSLSKARFRMPAFLDTLGLHGLGLSAPYDSSLSTPQGVGISTPSQVNLHALVGQSD